MIINNFISVDKVKEFGLIHENVDTKIISTCIRRAQDTTLQDALGTSLYRELNKRIINQGGPGGNEGITGVYEVLMKDYVWPALIAWTDYRASKYQKRKIRNKTTGEQSDEYIAPLSKSELTAMKDDLTSDASRYTRLLIGHLIDSCSDNIYPEYKKEECLLQEFVPAQVEKFRSQIYS